MVKLQTKKKKGQVTLEYIILVAAIIAIFVIFLNPTTGVFSQSLNQTLKTGTNQMINMAGRLATSQPPAP